MNCFAFNFVSYLPIKAPCGHGNRRTSTKTWEEQGCATPRNSGGKPSQPRLSPLCRVAVSVCLSGPSGLQGSCILTCMREKKHTVRTDRVPFLMSHLRGWKKKPNPRSPLLGSVCRQPARPLASAHAFQEVLPRRRVLRVCWQGARWHRCLSAEGHCGILKAEDEDLVVRMVRVSHLPSRAALCHAVCRICRGRACFWREAIPSDNG